MIAPVIALITWSLIMLVWLYARRIPAIFRHGIRLSAFKTVEGRKLLSDSVNAASDNYSHLMEQPTLFYALCLAIQLGPFSDETFRTLAWIYVGLRVCHSLLHVTVNIVTMRFLIFLCGTGVLAVMVWRTFLALVA